MSDKPAQNLGEFLRSEREKRGLSIEQVSSATKIGIKILYALEADQYGELPALPFVRGFIRNYAKFIGLDSLKLLEDYHGFLESHSKQRPNRDAGHSGYAFERPEGEQSRKMLWAIMGSMVVLGGLVVFVFKPSLKSRHGHVEKLKVKPSPFPSTAVEASPLPSVPPSAVPVVVASPSLAASPSVAVAFPSPSSKPSPSPSAAVVAVASPIATPSVSASPSPSPSPSASAKPDPLQSGVDYVGPEVKFKILVKALEDVTVRYQCDDKKTMRFTLKKDRILVLRGRQSIRFQASNPDSISYNPNGLGYRIMSTSEHRFDYANTASLIWPLKDRGKINENFKADAPLPATLGPGEMPVIEPSPQPT